MNLFHIIKLINIYAITTTTIQPVRNDPMTKDGIKNISKKIVDSQPNGILKHANIEYTTVVQISILPYQYAYIKYISSAISIGAPNNIVDQL